MSSSSFKMLSTKNAFTNINRILHWITNKNWYAIKPNQPSDRQQGVSNENFHGKCEKQSCECWGFLRVWQSVNGSGQVRSKNFRASEPAPSHWGWATIWETMDIFFIDSKNTTSLFPDTVERKIKTHSERNFSRATCVTLSFQWICRLLVSISSNIRLDPGMGRGL